jgi:hypothetical protein
MAARPCYVAGGNINPSRFVKVSTAADNTVLEADANEGVAGISGVGTKEPPGIDTLSGLLAQAGDNVQVFGDGEVCMLKLGSGGVTRGGYLKSDADGKGVAIATTGTTAQEIGAIALESGAADELVRVQVYRQHKTYPALT